MSLNFLKKLFNFYTEKKPKRAMSKFGVFIRSGQNDGEIIDGCRRFHQDIKSDAKIVAVKRNEACKGMELFFNSGSGVLELLKKKYLNGSDGVSTIHSLTTALSLHDAFPVEEEDFKKAVRSQIQNLCLVQVLDILKVPFNWEYPDIGSGKWIIVLDVPEVDDLDVFKTMGLPDNMVMEFPSNGDRYGVKFYCRLCQKDGHVQFRCLEGASVESHSPLENLSSPSRTMNLINKEKVTISPKPSSSKVVSRFRIRDKSEEPIPELHPSALPQAIEEFEREIGTEEARRYFTDTNIKQEDDKKAAPSAQLKRDCVSEVSDPPAKRPFYDSRYENAPKLDAEKPNFDGENSNRASSTTTEKDPEPNCETKHPYSRRCSQNPPDNSPLVTTTHNQSDAAVKQELPITDEEDSNPAPKRRKKASPMLQVVIPENIRAIINSVPEKVLDIRHLEAFFNHVKKKSRPADFARMYTENVEGLYQQLSEISRRYYLSLIVGSNEDLKFVKMLGNVLQRFHNGPAKRKSDTKM